jgi:aminoglycoside phosphotransferase (APT) family kinase protein
VPCGASCRWTVLESTSVRWPTAEVEMSKQLVQELVRSQHPDLIHYEIREMSPGFDNTIWRLGEELLVRLPRRQAAVRLIENEQRWLPELAARLPLSVPTPIRVGRPSELFPWPWTISKWIAGTPGNEVESGVLRGAAFPLGNFFRALHRDAPTDAPRNDFRSVPLRSHEANFGGRLEEVGDAVSRDDVSRVWQSALDADTWEGTPQWIHGDPHPANLIFRRNDLVGVIDFGDLCAGDPATDLAGGFLALPFGALSEYVAAYGAISEATLRRTLGWAVHFGLMFILLGATDEPTYGPLGYRAIDNAVAYAGAIGTA